MSTGGTGAGVAGAGGTTIGSTTGCGGSGVVVSSFDSSLGGWPSFDLSLELLLLELFEVFLSLSDLLLESDLLLSVLSSALGSFLSSLSFSVMGQAKEQKGF